MAELDAAQNNRNSRGAWAYLALRDVIAALGVAVLCVAAPARGAEAGPGHGHPAPAAARSSAIEPVHAERIGEWQGAPLYRTTLVSPEHHIDRIYHSMEGPLHQRGFRLDPGPDRELLWMTGYEATVVGPQAQPLSQEFMCHSSVAANQHHYGRLLPTKLGPKEGRMFTLAQGQQRVRLPEGHAIPFLSDQRLELQSQVLNHNFADADLKARIRIAIDFVRDRDLVAPVVPLTIIGASGLKLVEGDHAYFGLAPNQIDPKEHGPGCSIGVAAGHEFSDAFERRFTAHWVVPPGREENHTRVTDQLALPYDTTIHYAAVHLHPFAESLVLRDLSSNETVFEVQGRSAAERIALEEVGFVSSAEGIPLRAGHEYELASIYDNHTEVDQDAMASIYLYVRVRDVDLESIRERAARAGRARKGRLASEPTRAH